MYSQIDKFVRQAKARGWSTTHAQLTSYIGNGADSSATIYVQGPNGEYLPSVYCRDDDTLETKLADRLPPLLKDYIVTEFLESCAKLKERAEDLGLSPDFVNPITALADQLRTNILPKPAAPEAEGEVL